MGQVVSEVSEISNLISAIDSDFYACFVICLTFFMMFNTVCMFPHSCYISFTEASKF
jgi:hypothetical protein